MKKILLLIPCIIFFAGLDAQVVNIPDQNFKNALLNYPQFVIDTNADGQIQVSEAAAVHALIISASIADLTGIEAFVNLENLNCTFNNLVSLDVSGLTHLAALFCGSNQLTSLKVSGLNNLIVVDCQNNLLDTLDLSGLSDLNSVMCNNNHLRSLSVANCPMLTVLHCTNNQLTSLNFTGCGNLSSFECVTNQLTSLDLSMCSQLNYINCVGNQLVSLNVKNGTITNSIHIYPNFSLQYVCADEGEINGILNELSQYGVNNVSVNSYCSFTPGGSYNTISGKITMDLNNNGCDAGDPILPNLTIKINDGTNTGYTSTTNSGTYSLFTNAGNFTISPKLENPYFTITPASTTVNFASVGGSVQAVNFCFVPNGVHNDVEVSLIPISSARPGFDAYYKLVYKNKGTLILSGNVSIAFADDKLDLVTATPGATTQSTGSLNWAYTNLQPFETRTIDIRFNLLPPPVNNNGEALTFNCNITPVAGDETPRDNSFSLKQPITGSFDPNDKTCLEGDSIDITRVGDYIHYLIRFQNTGTESAENVVVKDVLQNNLDWNSFELTKTSHPCVVKQTDGNKLEFIFQGINLPALSTDEPGSHGFIAFKIKTIGSLNIGDSVKNNAAIYFDFNLPVITNTAGSVIDSITIVPITIEYLKGSIQSGKHLLNWKANCTSIQATFTIERSTDARKYNSIGSITASNTRCLQPFDFIDNDLVAGINYYRIKMTDVDGKISYSSTIALLNKKSGFEIVNLLSNPVIGGSALLNITSAEKQSINIVVSDASGKTVQTIDQQLIPGFTQIKMNFATLAAGMYTITIYTANGERKTKQFIKQ